MKSLAQRIEKISKSDKLSFLELAEISGLDPSEDFKFLNLAGFDFSDCDLSNFDFSGCKNVEMAIFSNTRISGAKFDARLETLLALREAKDFKETLRGYPMHQKDASRIVALFTACKDGDLKEVKRGIRDGIPVNFELSGQTPLFVAACHGRLAIAELLLDMGADPEVRCYSCISAWAKKSNRAYSVSYAVPSADITISLGLLKILNRNREYIYVGERWDTPVENQFQYYLPDLNESALVYSPLSIACLGGHLETAKFIATVTDLGRMPSHAEVSPFSSAVLSGNIRILRTLTAIQTRPEQQEFLNFMHPLAIAIFQNDIASVSELLRWGAEIEYPDRLREHWDSLTLCASVGNLSIAKLILNSSKDNFEFGNKFLNPINVAILHGTKDFLSLILNHPRLKLKPRLLEGGLLASAYLGRLDFVRLILNTDAADVSYFSPDGGYTALILATMYGHAEVVRSLIEEYGADPNQSEIGGMTPLMYACEQGHSLIVKYLVEQGADHSLKEIDGFSSLMFASQNGQLEIVDYLLKVGADVEAVAKDGSTSLMKACVNGHLRVVQRLVALASGIHATDLNGWSALMFASSQGHIATVEYLISLGADVNHPDLDGRTSLMSASERGHLSVVETLLGSDADVAATTKSGDTALVLAERSNQKEVSDLLRLLGGPPKI